MMIQLRKKRKMLFRLTIQSASLSNISGVKHFSYKLRKGPLVYRKRHVCFYLQEAKKNYFPLDGKMGCLSVAD